MAKQFLTSINLNGNQLLNPVLEQLSSLPTPNVEGRFGYHGSRLVVNDGTEFKSVEWLLPTGTTGQYLRGDKTLSNFMGDTRATTLTGLSTTNSGISATDTILSAMGKLQGQITARPGTVTSVSTGTISGNLTASIANGTSTPTISIGVATNYTIPNTTQWNNVYDWYNSVGKYWSFDSVTDSLHTEKNVWSEQEISAYGFGGTGGGGGTGSHVEWGTTLNNYSPLLVEGTTKTVALSGHTHKWADLTDKPTTLSGLGILSSDTLFDNRYIRSTLRGQAGGIAELDAAGKVPASQLPSYVDDVLEFSSLSAFPTTGETGKIYVAIDTNRTYRWSGTTYIEIAKSVGTVTSVGLSAPAGFEVSNTPITGSGVIALSFADDYRLFTTAEANKLAGIAAGAQVNVATNLAVGTRTTTTMQVTSSTGTAVVLPQATTTQAGLLVSTDKAKIDLLPTSALGGFVRRVSGNFSGSSASYTITHNIGSQDVVAQVIHRTSNEVVECDIVMTSANTITFSFNVPPALNTYRYVIVG